jgi:hypothetical protein
MFENFTLKQMHLHKNKCIAGNKILFNKIEIQKAQQFIDTTKQKKIDC